MSARHFARSAGDTVRIAKPSTSSFNSCTVLSHNPSLTIRKYRLYSAVRRSAASLNSSIAAPSEIRGERHWRSTVDLQICQEKRQPVGRNRLPLKPLFDGRDARQWRTVRPQKAKKPLHAAELFD